MALYYFICVELCQKYPEVCQNYPEKSFFWLIGIVCIGLKRGPSDIGTIVRARLKVLCLTVQRSATSEHVWPREALRKRDVFLLTSEYF